MRLMFDRHTLLPEDQTASLLEIGRRLRAEYAAVEEPIPERLATLVAQLEDQQQEIKTPLADPDEVPTQSEAGKKGGRP
jgi:hypothetical protein